MSFAYPAQALENPLRLILQRLRLHALHYLHIYSGALFSLLATAFLLRSRKLSFGDVGVVANVFRWFDSRSHR